MIVIDVNILAYFSITGEKTALAQEAIRRDANIVSPVLWRSEFRNILVKYLRQGLMSIEDANAILTSVETRMKGRERNVDSIRVVELAFENSCSAYDAEYVVLAQQLSVRLLSEDKEVLKKFPDVAISLQDFVSSN